eukprot:6097803-Karenia_brevis.AAC.1
MMQSFQMLLSCVPADGAIFAFGLLLQQLAALHWHGESACENWYSCDQLQSSRTAHEEHAPAHAARHAEPSPQLRAAIPACGQ